MAKISLGQVGSALLAIATTLGILWTQLHRVRRSQRDAAAVTHRRLDTVRQLTTARLIDTIVSQTDDKRSFLPERPREDIVHLITNTPSVYLHHALSDLQTAWLLDIRQSTITHFQSIRNQVVLALGIGVGISIGAAILWPDRLVGDLSPSLMWAVGLVLAVLVSLLVFIYGMERRSNRQMCEQLQLIEGGEA